MPDAAWRECFDSGVLLEIDSGTQENLLKKLRRERSANLTLVVEHLGLKKSPKDESALARSLKADQLVELAVTAEFARVAEKVAQAFYRKATVWKRRAGVLRFHRVSVAKRLAAYFDSADRLFRRFALEIEQQGFMTYLRFLVGLSLPSGSPHENYLPLLTLASEETGWPERT
ncbi:MAG: hypothetical protein KDB22_17960 [Planctomycetales bacterium]|nr:hypothetical protein [Planctomycetales bacterium]